MGDLKFPAIRPRFELFMSLKKIQTPNIACTLIIIPQMANGDLLEEETIKKNVFRAFQ